jgi:hypothetical protein
LCLLLAEWRSHCFGTLLSQSSSSTRTTGRQTTMHSIVPCLNRIWNPLLVVNTDKLCCFASWQRLTLHKSSNSQNNSKTEIWASPHPAYSPDHVPYNYHISESLQDALHGWWLANDEEFKDAVHTWFCKQLNTFSTDGLRKLVDQSNEYVWRSWGIM